MQREVDVLIVGAGPAGLSAGIVLAQEGLRTLICERGRLPVDKVCGEGIMPTGLADLERLGVKQHLTSEYIHPFRGIRYYSAGGHLAGAPFAAGPGWGVRRTALSAALWQRARELHRLTVCDGTQATPLVRTAEGITVQVGRNNQIKTRLLIGADGLRSRVRRWAGLDGPPRALKRWGVRQHFTIVPWSEYVEVHWGSGIEAYITPCGPEQVSIAFLWDPARFCDVRGGADFFSSLLQTFPQLRARLAGAAVCDSPGAIGPMCRTAIAPVGDRVLLIGDAAGYLDAITCEGISLATAQALSLAQSVAPLLKDHRQGRLNARDLGAYASAWRGIVRPYYQLTRLVLWLSCHPVLAERAIGALERQPDVFQHLLAANMGLTSPWALSARKKAQFLWRLLA